MAKREVEMQETLTFASPVVGTVLTVAAAISFQLLCMVLPVVGKAGMNPSREYAVRGMMNVSGPHGFDSYVTENRIAFLVALFVTLGLSIAAALSKAQRRKIEGGAMAKLPIILIVCCVGLLAAHATGLLQI